MSGRFLDAFPYKEDVLTLPVTSLDIASSWYSSHFGLVEVERLSTPIQSLTMERDGVKIGFVVNGKDPSQDGAAILVKDIEALKEEFTANGVTVANERVDDHDGQKLNVFFVVAPDGLCYYIHEPINTDVESA